MAGGIPRPGGRLRRFFSESSPYDLIISAIAMSVGVIGAAKYIQEDKPTVGIVLICAAVAAFLVNALKVLVTFLSKEKARAIHDLEGCLYLLHDILLLAQQDKAIQNPHLRLTLHVPFDNNQSLQQVIAYVGDGRAGDTANRVFPAQCGIIGKVLREGASYLIAKRKNTDHLSYVQELVQEWGYTEPDARKRDPSPMAWMAVALEHNKKVEGIVYLDAVDPNFFDHENVKQVVLSGCAGIARYATQRYK